jgi:hypothetical protein
MFLTIFLLAADITPETIPEPAPIVCTSSMDDKGNVSTPPCLAPNTGNMPDLFVIDEGDRH